MGVDSRVLFLDDSGKPEVSHASKAVVIAGLAVSSEDYPTLARRILGAKAHFFPNRGVPQRWEIKSEFVVKPNPWNRAKNRNFAYELARIVRDIGGTFYAVTIVKANMKNPMTLATSMPLQLQCLVDNFATECMVRKAMGLVVADWSTHQYDQHASQCVASFVASRKLAIHPCVYYASSHGNEAIQVADIVAAVRRRAAEGDGKLGPFDQHLAGIRSVPPGAATSAGRIYDNYVTLF